MLRWWSRRAAQSEPITTQAHVDEAARLVEAINTFTRMAMESRDYRDREAMQQIVRHAFRELTPLVLKHRALRVHALSEWEADFKMICRATLDLKRETQRKYRERIR